MPRFQAALAQPPHYSALPASAYVVVVTQWRPRSRGEEASFADDCKASRSVEDPRNGVEGEAEGSNLPLTCHSHSVAGTLPKCQNAKLARSPCDDWPLLELQFG